MSPARNNNKYRRQQAATPTRVNLGPLTTTFVAPSHCSRNALACPTCTNAIRGQSCRVNGATVTAEDDTGCWPRATAYPDNGQGPGKAPLFGMGFYSPGIACPTGFTSACTAVSQTDGQSSEAAPQVTGRFQWPLVAGETAVGCCPTGYSCAIDGGVQTCHLEVTSTQFDAMTCNGVTEGDLNGFKVPFTSGTQTVGTMHLFAPLIQINHQATDLPEEVGAEDETSAAASATSLLTMSLEPSSTPADRFAIPTLSSDILPERPDSIGDDDHRLPTGTKIGIACAPLMGAAIILGIMAYFKWKKRYLYPPEHFVPKKSGSPDPSEPSSRHAEAGEAGFQDQNLSYSPPMNDDPTFSAAHNPHDFAMGPGPVVVADSRQEKMAGIEEEADTHAARFGRSLDGDGFESPIDGTSPFRLKRGNTLKMRDQRLTPEDRDAARRTSPLVRSESVNSEGSSQDGVEREYPIKREDSFTKPRPRPKTGASSVYFDDRTSSVYSWNNAVTAEMPTAVERKKSMRRADSYSQPRPKRDESEDTLVGRNVVAVPRGEGVAF